MAEFEKKIYFFGCGTVAKNIFALYKDTFNISGFITDFPEDWGKVVDGITVYSPEKILQNRNNFIVIATNKSVEKIYNRFKNLGLIPDQDFSHYEKWLRIHFENVFREKNILLQYLAECYITDRCNLKCKNCALFVPYFSKANDRDFEEVKRDISLYFKFVDRVSVFRLLGGETFLYKKLNSLLEFMGGGGILEKIGKLHLVSNGTIIPSEETLKILAKYKIAVSISNYPLDICKRQRPKLIKAFNDFGVEYVIPENDYWYDVWGDPKLEKYQSDSQIKKIFQNCYVWCRIVHKGKFYFCLNDLAAKRMGYVEDSPEDYVDLEQSDEQKIKSDILLLDSKKNPKGYINACRNCFSLSSQNNRIIKVAEQLTKNFK